MTPLDRWDTTAYKSSIVTIALFCTVLRYLFFEEYCDLEIQVRSHSRSLKIAPFNILPMVSVSC